MKKDMKYIKIKGVMTSRGEYNTAPDEHRPYEAVTVVDEDGVRVHFHTLFISKRMDEDVSLGEPYTFYIFRYRFRSKMYGALFAIEKKGKKIYYPDTSVSVVKAIAASTSIRNYLTSLHGSFLLLLAFIPLGIAFAFPVNAYYLLFLATVLGGCFFMFYPRIFPSKYIDLPQMKKVLEEDGFEVGDSGDSKY
ncbi:hypothetical protein V6243_06480 [Cobetia marina]|uniref:DUF2812 domain-containing protein n=1 Tax=Cobetia marina TaxID=28258 RepID=A0ABU9GDC3_COBMA